MCVNMDGPGAGAARLAMPSDQVETERRRAANDVLKQRQRRGAAADLLTSDSGVSNAGANLYTRKVVGA